MQKFEVTVTKEIEANSPEEAVAKFRWSCPTETTTYEVTGGDLDYGSSIPSYQEVI